MKHKIRHNKRILMFVGQSSYFPNCLSCTPTYRHGATNKTNSAVMDNWPLVNHPPNPFHLSPRKEHFALFRHLLRVITLMYTHPLS